MEDVIANLFCFADGYRDRGRALPVQCVSRGSRTRVDKVVIQVFYLIELHHMPNTFRLRTLLFMIDCEEGKLPDVAKTGFSRS
jgi:hypothetical protein